MSWTLDGTAFALEVTVPPNTTADVSMPDGSAPVEVGSGRHSFTAWIPEPQLVAKPALFFDPEAFE